MKDYKTITPEIFFKENNLTESLILEYRFLPELSEIILVIDYADDAVQLVLSSKSKNWKYDRDFRKLRFKNVSNYSREEGTRKDLIPFKNNYHIKQHTAQKVIHHVEFKNKGAEYNINMDLGDFGSVDFVFTDLEVTRRLGKGEKISENEWQYYDVETNEPFDFYHPFT